MERKASGELSGTSIMVMPAETSASQTAMVSGGVMPRRMAMRWRWSMVYPWRAALRPASVASVASTIRLLIPMRRKAR